CVNYYGYDEDAMDYW
nr:immunoglobulin heavy chain junction region [Mus musculus]MBK4189622.1 immunoglobulin heavy chain junction region [Mus musculus]MBK4189624.1 immunoglobulin heavy chain junction region [Mus musculus]